MRSIYDKISIDMYNGTAPFCEGSHNLIFTEIWTNDCYKIREVAQKFLPLATIVDVGANIGLFTVTARHYYPWSKIIAIEPFASTYNHLIQNTKGLNVETHQTAYGNGKNYELVEGRSDGLNSTIYSDKSDKKTMTLEDMNIDLSLPFMIKSDCEGAEEAFFSGKDLEIVQQSTLLSMEAHLDKCDFESFVKNIMNTHSILVYNKRIDAPLVDFVAINKKIINGK